MRRCTRLSTIACGSLTRPATACIASRSLVSRASKPAFFQSIQYPTEKRWNSSLSTPVELPKIVPKYKITFTCKACDHRSSHEMSKQAYTKGTVLIQCPSCKNRHLIADNLKIFSDKNINIEDILSEKGQAIKKGHISEGDLEFFPEGEDASGPMKAIT